MINLKNRIASFEHIGQLLNDAANNNTTKNPLVNAAKKAQSKNPWFTPQSINHAYMAWASLLNAQNLTQWLQPFREKAETSTPKTIGVVSAGNIPMVGMHDFLSVLLMGNKIQIKLSAKDNVLISEIAQTLIDFNPQWNHYIEITENTLTHFDAIIATGSNNSARYFESYFAQYPNIIRHNRSSVAIIDNATSDTQLKALADDIFRYFGLGCRNVSKLFVPEGFDFNRLFNAFKNYENICHHNKYGNNFDYQLAIHLMNQTNVFNTGQVILKESSDLFSPIGVLLYEFYSDKQTLTNKLAFQAHHLQCIVGAQKDNTVNTLFGQTQLPGLTDYADNVNTLEFLANLQLTN